MNKSQLESIIPVIAKEYGFRTALIEKDYYLTIVLNAIRTNLSKNLVLKGGTLLNKIYLKYSRLSEDLDFTYYSKQELSSRSKKSAAIRPIKEKMVDFLNYIGLSSVNAEGEGFNNSTQYIFYIYYSSFITGKTENIKIEISLRHKLSDKAVYNSLEHFYQDPFTGKDLVPKNNILSLSFREATAEKLKAAITRKNAAVRDFYDLWYISETGFNFLSTDFLRIFKEKLEQEQYKGDFRFNFGLTKEVVKMLRSQVNKDLAPVIKTGVSFEIDKVFKRFNNILKRVK